jgi:hypothetical protein
MKNKLVFYKKTVAAGMLYLKISAFAIIQIVHCRVNGVG